MTQKQVLKEFYDLQTCSPKRLDKIKNILEKSGELIGKDLTALKLTDVTKFLREVNNSSFSEWTKNDYKKIFKSFLKWHYKKDFLEWSENKQFQEGFKGVSKLKAMNRDKINKNTLIKPEELEKLLRSAKNLKWKALLTLFYESAFRPCEIVNLKWKDLKFDDSRNLCSLRTTSPKTRETREIPIRDCIVHLKRWREEFEFPNRTEQDFVFPNPTDRNSHLSEAGIGIILKRLCRKAGIRDIFPYLFRHTRIYEIQKKLGSRIASKFAGHSLETSEIYNHLDSDDVEQAMLEKVYVTEELTPEKRNELELMIEQVKKENAKLKATSVSTDELKKALAIIQEEYIKKTERIEKAMEKLQKKK